MNVRIGGGRPTKLCRRSKLCICSGLGKEGGCIGAASGVGGKGIVLGSTVGGVLVPSLTDLPEDRRREKWRRSEPCTGFDSFATCVLDEELRLAGEGRGCVESAELEPCVAIGDTEYLAFARLDAKLFDGKTLPVGGVTRAGDSVGG